MPDVGMYGQSMRFLHAGAQQRVNDRNRAEQRAREAAANAPKEGPRHTALREARIDLHYAGQHSCNWSEWGWSHWIKGDFAFSRPDEVQQAALDAYLAADRDLADCPWTE